MVGVTAAMHFLVDGLCVCCLYLMLDTPGIQGMAKVFLTYNILAFMTQPLTGWMADRTKHRHWLLLAAVVLLAAAVMMASVVAAASGVRSGVWLVALLLGTGNSLFHVWGGKQTVLTMGNDMRAMGVFVSTGAFGLAVGVTFHSWGLLQTFLLLICLLSLTHVRMDGTFSKGETAKQGKTYGQTIVWCSMAALVAFVMFRSYSGEVFSAGMHKTPVVVLMVGGTAMLGKMAGGWLATRWGIVKSMVVVLMATALCFAAGPSSVALLLAGVFLINCTMPVTLYLANVVLEGREGLAFGILAAALIPGYLLATS
jgi:hypothetical protein